jgi:hypothetical protein
LLAPSTLTGGELDAALNDSGTDGVSSKSGSIVDAQFLHEIPAMLFDGLRADAEFRCGLFVGLMARGDKSSYTDKQKRMAEHIEEGYEKRGVSTKESEKRAWATVNKVTSGGKKSDSGRDENCCEKPFLMAAIFSASKSKPN